MYNVKNVAREPDDPWPTMALVQFRLYREKLTTPSSSCGNLASTHKCAFSRPGIKPRTCDFTVRRASHSAAIRRLVFISFFYLDLICDEIRGRLVWWLVGLAAMNVEALSKQSSNSRGGHRLRTITGCSYC